MRHVTDPDVDTDVGAHRNSHPYGDRDEHAGSRYADRYADRYPDAGNADRHSNPGSDGDADRLVLPRRL
jgi:hypothetical protein